MNKNEQIEIIKKLFNINKENADDFRVVFNKGHTAVYRVIKTDRADSDKKEIEFYVIENGQVINTGCLVFGKNDDYIRNRNTIWIYHFEMHHARSYHPEFKNQQKYRGKGLAAFGLKFFEEYVFNKGITIVDGDFRPDTSAGGTAYETYIKNGYSISYADYPPSLSKTLTAEIMTETENNTDIISEIKVYRPWLKWEKSNPQSTNELRV